MASAKSKGGRADWMKDLPIKYHDKPFNTLAIPGSHDSFAFQLDKRDTIAPDVEKTAFGKLAKSPLKLPVKSVIWNWSITQSMNFLEQLNSGIRYFDLRVGFKENATKGKNKSEGAVELANHFHFVHGLYGVKLEQAFTVFNYFLKDHDKEVIILHFQHFYNFNSRKHSDCQDLVCKKFHGKLCPPATDAQEVTLNGLWENGQQVIVLYNHQIKDDHEQLLWHTRMIHSPWPNVSCPKKLIAKLKKNCGKTRDHAKFHVSQGVLTPDTSLIVKNVGSSLKEKCAKRAAGSVVRWISRKKSHDHGLNIFIMDYVEMADFIPCVLNLNRHQEMPDQNLADSSEGGCSESEEESDKESLEDGEKQVDSEGSDTQETFSAQA